MSSKSLLVRQINAVLSLVTCASLIGCAELYAPNIRPHRPNVASLRPLDWYIFHSDTMPSHPSPDPGGAWSFAFPASGHVGYVQTPFNATAMLHTVSVTFRVESDRPQFRIIDPSDHLPATVHLFFEIQNDNGADANGRWWATESGYDLGSQDNSTIRFVVPLTPDQWSNVEGQYDPTSFYNALSNIGWIGMTFGGQSFFGHGVGLRNGDAKYILIDLVVE